MASVGQVLTAPETGWRRYDDSDSRIRYTGTWVTNTIDTKNYGTSNHNTNIFGNTVKFKFYGTALRLYDMMYANREKIVNITIDGVADSYNSYSTSSNDTHQTIVYEKTGLPPGLHDVTLTKGTNDTSYLCIDAIDIDSNGYLLHPILNQSPNIDSMQVGDCIPFRYTALTSGVLGFISEVGTCKSNEIPITPAVTADGLAYLIKVDTGVLIPDRQLQTGITWNTLNVQELTCGKAGKPPYANTTNLDVFATAVGSTSAMAYTRLGTNYLSFYCTSTSGNVQYNYALGGVTSRLKFKISQLSIDATNVFAFYGKEYGKSYSLNITPTTISVCDGNGLNSKTLYVGDTVNKVIDIFSDIRNSFLSLYIDGVCIYFSQVPTSNPTWNQNSSIYICAFTNANTTKYLKYEYFYSISNGLQQMHNMDNSVVKTPSGGCAFMDALGNKSLTCSSNGMWPDNDYDRYLNKSTLNGKITASDPNIWHHKVTGQFDWMLESPVTGTFYGTSTSVSAVSSPAYRITRGISSNTEWVDFGFDNVTGAYGFRPIIRYLDKTNINYANIKNYIS